LREERLHVASGALLRQARSTIGVCSWPRDDRVHADPLGRVLHRDDSRELDHRGLGRRVPTCALPVKRMPEVDAMFTIAPPPCLSITE